MGASGSADGGTRLESTESLERTFEGPGCGGRTGSLSLALDSQWFRCSSVPDLPSGLRGGTTGASLRFSRCHELFIIIHDRGRRTSPLLCWGLVGTKTATSGRLLFVSSRLEAWAGGEGKGTFGSKS
jgi:hypothetical protein